MGIFVHASIPDIFNKCYKMVVFLGEKNTFWGAKYEFFGCFFFGGGVTFYMMEGGSFFLHVQGKRRGDILFRALNAVFLKKKQLNFGIYIYNLRA